MIKTTLMKNPLNQLVFYQPRNHLPEHLNELQELGHGALKEKDGHRVPGGKNPWMHPTSFRPGESCAYIWHRQSHITEADKQKHSFLPSEHQDLSLYLGGVSGIPPVSSAHHLAKMRRGLLFLPFLPSGRPLVSFLPINSPSVLKSHGEM